MLDASDIVTIFGTILAVLLNLSPGVLFYQYFKGEKMFKDIPELMFVVGVFCCTTNLAYGLLLKNKNLYINGAICEIIQVSYATIYLFIYADKDFSKWFLYVFIAYNLTLEILYIFADVFKYHFGFDFADNFTGWFNVALTVLNAGAPGQKLIEVWKTGNFTLIPIVTTFTQILCSGLWGIYGFTILNPKVYVPNVFGVILCLVQITSYFIFYIKNNGVAPNTPSKEKKTNKKEEEKDSGTTKLIDNSNIPEESNDTPSNEKDPNPTEN